MTTGIKSLADKRSDIFHVRLNAVMIEDGFNPREDYGNLDELAQSLAAEGQKCPGEVRLGENGDTVVLIDGHRRFEAIKLANSKYGAEIRTFACVKEARGTNAETRLLSTLVTNSGKPLTPLEEASCYKRLIAYGMDKKEIARRTGKKATYINKLLDVLASTPELREALSNNKISLSAAIELAREPENKQRSVLARNERKVKVSDVQKSSGKVYTVSTKKIRSFLEEIEAHATNKTKAKVEKVSLIATGIKIALGELTVEEALQ